MLGIRVIYSSGWIPSNATCRCDNSPPHPPNVLPPRCPPSEPSLINHLHHHYHQQTNKIPAVERRKCFRANRPQVVSLFFFSFLFVFVTYRNQATWRITVFNPYWQSAIGVFMLIPVSHSHDWREVNLTMYCFPNHANCSTFWCVYVHLCLCLACLCLWTVCQFPTLPPPIMFSHSKFLSTYSRWLFYEYAQNLFAFGVKERASIPKFS